LTPGHHCLKATCMILAYSSLGVYIQVSKVQAGLAGVATDVVVLPPDVSHAAMPCLRAMTPARSEEHLSRARRLNQDCQSGPDRGPNEMATSGKVLLCTSPRWGHRHARFPVLQDASIRIYVPPLISRCLARQASCATLRQH
jgi:hypothetical protein